MTDENHEAIKRRKAWIDGADYDALLQCWRFAPVGSPLFQGEVGDYYRKVMAEKKKATPVSEQVRVSKALG